LRQAPLFSNASMLVCALRRKSVRVHDVRGDDVRVVVEKMRPGASVPAAQIFDITAPIPPPQGPDSLFRCRGGLWWFLPRTTSFSSSFIAMKIMQFFSPSHGSRLGVSSPTADDAHLKDHFMSLPRASRCNFRLGEETSTYLIEKQGAGVR
jgi:hypothetical protein